MSTERVKVTTQVEFEAALERGQPIEITAAGEYTVKAGKANVFVAAALAAAVLIKCCGSCEAVAHGHSRVEARESSSVEARGSSRVEARGSSSVVARGSSRVVARGSSRVVARGSSRVVAWGSSRVVAWESSRVVARGSSRVEARGSSSVVARGSSSVVAWGSSSVVAWESSRVVAWGSSSVVAWESSRVVANGSGVPFGENVKLLNREDFRAVLTAAPNEVAGLRAALVEGKIDGSCYDGACCCLVGTLEKVRGCKQDEIVPRNAERPAEQLFMPLKPGMTPLNSPLAAIIVNWIDEWQREKAGAGA